MKKCTICSNEVIAKDIRIKCCSPECSKINYKQYQKEFHTREIYKEYQKDYDKRLRKHRSSYINSDKRKKYIIEWRKGVKWKNYKKKWDSTPKGRIYLFNKWRRRRARKNNIIEIFTQEEWQQMKEVTKGVCPRCNKHVGLDYITLDHIYALVLAYKDFLNTGVKRIYNIKDIQPLCGKCNSSKCAKPE